MRQSLRFRLLVIGGLILLLFLGLTGWSLDRAMASYASQAEFQRLQGMVYGLLAVTEVDDRGGVTIDDRAQPEVRLRQPGSGLAVWVVNEKNQTVWQSLTAVAMPPALDSRPAVGDWQFTPSPSPLLQFGFEWQEALNRIFRYTFVVSDASSPLQAQRSSFSTRLWWGLLAAALLLLLTLMALFFWSMRPLRAVVSQLDEIKKGEREALDGQSLAEIQPLTQSINALLVQERQRQQRYKHSMADLAHSLKTPLSVLKGRRPGDADAASDAISRIDQIISYQLQRASAASGQLLHKAIEVEPVFRRTASVLSKVYTEKQPRFEFDFPPSARLPMDEGDLMEIAGNLLENACRFCSGVVRISAQRSEDSIVLLIGDDGAGFPIEAGRLLKRGVRADSLTPGQGIGLAVVRELVETYGGTIELGNGERGAQVTLRFPL